MEQLTTLYIDKERHKFSAAHYTIFSATERERLHGHNYSVSACIVAPMGDNGFAADYNVYKHRLGALCEQLDEYMLLAGQSPYQQIAEDGAYYRVDFAAEQMLFLRSDTLVLPIRNATVEELSRYLLQGLIASSAVDDLRDQMRTPAQNLVGHEGLLEQTPVPRMLGRIHSIDRDAK